MRSKLSTQSKRLTEIWVNKFLKQVFRGILFQGNEDFPGERGEFFLVMLPIKSFQIKVSRTGWWESWSGCYWMYSKMDGKIDRYIWYCCRVCRASHNPPVVVMVLLCEKSLTLPNCCDWSMFFNSSHSSGKSVSEFENLKGPCCDWLRAHC